MAERAARLALCDLTARVLKEGLNVLGIETAEQMKVVETDAPQTACQPAGTGVRNSA